VRTAVLLRLVLVRVLAGANPGVAVRREEVRARSAHARMEEVRLCSLRAYNNSNLLEMRVGSAVL
jgi:hypothetical protein